VCKQCLHPIFLAIILFNHSLSCDTYAQTVGEASDVDAYASMVSDLEGTRLRINLDSENTLASIPVIGDEGARAIVARRTARAGIRSLHELAEMLNWTQEEYDLLEP
jgi:DNA uptake protein ComE-like DNA-binding protein